jgi:hypothetical protein
MLLHNQLYGVSMQWNFSRLARAVVQGSAMPTLVGAALLLGGVGHAQEVAPVMRAEDGKVQPAYVLGANSQRWPGGQFNWYYNPQNQPANLTTAAVLNAIQTAAARWSGMCNISFNYMGITAASPYLLNDPAAIDRVNIVGWGVPPDGSSTRGNTNKWYVGSAMVDADVMMNSTLSWTADNVDSLMTQAFGSSMGLSGSNVANSVISASVPHDPAFLRTLRGDDAQGCAALYGTASTAESNRALNWAEAAYAQYLFPAPATSGTYDGYYYRYYAGTSSYVGTKNGLVYFMGADGVIVSLGPLAGFSNLAQSAGF